MTYCFANLRRADDPEDGWRPDFPTGICFSLIADCRDSTDNIYEVSYCEECTSFRQLRSVDAQLAGLIDSAKRYPPALALAKDDLTRATTHASESLSSRFRTFLLQHLQACGADGFRLAQAVRGDGIDLCPGEWYWVRPVPEQQDCMLYVSADYYCYRARHADFR